MARLKPACCTLSHSPLLSLPWQGALPGWYSPWGEAFLSHRLCVLPRCPLALTGWHPPPDNAVAGWVGGNTRPSLPPSHHLEVHASSPTLPSQAGGWYQVSSLASCRVVLEGVHTQSWSAFWGPGVSRAAESRRWSLPAHEPASTRLPRPAPPSPSTQVPTSCCPPWCKRTRKIQLPVPFLSAFAAACLWKTGAG